MKYQYKEMPESMKRTYGEFAKNFGFDWKEFIMGIPTPMPKSEDIVFVLEISLLQASENASGNASGEDMDDPIYQNPF